MRVIHDTSPGAARHLDVEDACAFLHAEAERLGRALAHADIPTIVGPVLGHHDASHGAWLDLIADAERTDDAIAAHIEHVYGYHGCVVGVLERGDDPRLCAEVRRNVRRLLARELDERTAAAVHALRAARG